LLPHYKISAETRNQLRCPVCRSELTDAQGSLLCVNPACATSYPIIHGVPILINDSNSVFSIDDFTSQRSTTFELERTGIKSALARLMPSISKNMKAVQNFDQMATILLGQTSRPRILVVGGGILGAGMKSLAANPDIELVDSDVSFAPRTQLVCDGHDLPFADESFDGVIAQAVLECVVDPYRCVEEMHRVLRKDGLVYAETPFMQQVGLGRYDFTRFTHLGHRRLFRRFTEVGSGVVCGPGMALAWSWQFFWLSFVTGRRTRAVVKALARLTGFWLKYIDHILVDRPGAIDAASGCYFLGRKSDVVLPDKELVKQYRGMFQ
jgi:SAM-dependent methyltransferase/uncharacterized protein YbaR (Trm112 family)